MDSAYNVFPYATMMTQTQLSSSNNNTTSDGNGMTEQQQQQELDFNSSPQLPQVIGKAEEEKDTLVGMTSNPGLITPLSSGMRSSPPFLPSPPPPPPLSPFFADAVLDLQEAQDIIIAPPVYANNNHSNNTALQAKAKNNYYPTTTSRRHKISSSMESLGHEEGEGVQPHTQRPDREEIRANDYDWRIDTHNRNHQHHPLDYNGNDRSTAPVAIETESHAHIHAHASLRHTGVLSRPKVVPRWPRDIPWAVAFLLLVPTVLLGVLFTPSMHVANTNATETADSNSKSLSKSSVWTLALSTSSSLSTTCRAALLLSTLFGLSLVPLLYSSGRKKQHHPHRRCLAHAIVLVSPVVYFGVCIVSIVLLCLCIQKNIRTPGTTGSESIVRVWIAVAFVGLLLLCSCVWTGRLYIQLKEPTQYHHHHPLQPQQTLSVFWFHPALMETAFDVLILVERAASLRVIVGTVVLTQGAILALWHAAILQCLSVVVHEEEEEESLSSSSYAPRRLLHLIIPVLMAGQWASGTLTRFLTYMVSGSVAMWLDEQPQPQPQPHQMNHSNQDTIDSCRDSFHDPNGHSSHNQHNMKNNDCQHHGPFSLPEAYRSVDASVYQSGLMSSSGEENDDDDAEDDYEYGDYGDNDGLLHTMDLRGEKIRSSSSSSLPSTISSRRTHVQTLWLTGLTTSFGSIALCGCVDDWAEFVHSILRTVPSQSSSTTSSSSSLRRSWCAPLRKLARKCARRYSDIGMGHVAAYYKSYPRAAMDVSALVEAAEVDLLLEEDLTSHFLACAGGSIASLIVFASTLISLYANDEEKVDTRALLVNLLLSLYFSYTLMYTVLEPLRAVVKAVYVSFAQHPLTLSRTFPLLYHRLCRRLSNASSSSTSLRTIMSTTSKTAAPY